MENQLYKLKNRPCSSYLASVLKGSGYFTDKIVTDFDFSQGNFFCIAPLKSSEDTLYDFNSAIGMAQFRPYPEDLLLDTINSFLNSDQRFCIIEDSLALPSDAYIRQRSGEYFLVEDIIFYLVGNSNRIHLEQYLNYTKGHGFFPFLVEADIVNVTPHENISLSVKEKILSNVCVFFTCIYDGESYLIWCHKKFNSLIEILQSKSVKIDSLNNG